MVRYLTSEEVVEAHRLVLEWMGSPPRPLLRPDALDSALSRPAWAAFYQGASLVEQAVSLTIGISQSQAFEDGNKRAAFAAIEIFLVANGHVFVGDPPRPGFRRLVGRKRPGQRSKQLNYKMMKIL